MKYEEMQKLVARLDNLRNALQDLCLGITEFTDELMREHVAQAPICGVHQVPMVQVQGKKGPFWSCHQRNPDGSFCRYRPTTQ